MLVCLHRLQIGGRRCRRFAATASGFSRPEPPGTPNARTLRHFAGDRRARCTARFLALAIGTAFGLGDRDFSQRRISVLGTRYRARLLAADRTYSWLSSLPGPGRACAEESLIELLAAIPSVVYGLWGIFVVIPLIRPLCDWLHTHLGWIPLFGTGLSGPGLLPAVDRAGDHGAADDHRDLAATRWSRCRRKLREAAYGMGATRWEAILAVIRADRGDAESSARSSSGFGRALGETMALAMLAGNANQISWSLFSPANTLAALLANNFPEAERDQVGALMYAALVLLAITLVVNIVGTLILQRADAGLKGLR